MQVFPWSEGALYQIYAAPGQITNIALEPGERLTGPGPIAAGDTTRWIIGDTTSGSGRTERVHILVKPTRPDIATNLVVNTERRTYHIELHANEDTWMPSVAWAYPEVRSMPRAPILRRPAIPPEAERHYRYGLQGDTPPWRPVSVFDDGRRVYVVFPAAGSRRMRKRNPMASRVKHLWSQTLRRTVLHTDRTSARPTRVRSLRSRSDPPKNRRNSLSFDDIPIVVRSSILKLRLTRQRQTTPSRPLWTDQPVSRPITSSGALRLPRHA